ncbi:hypothetical protein Hanom_Chr06g00494961 [Helianthus anomalus]
MMMTPQSYWAYSKLVVILDLVQNVAFVLVAAVVLILSQEETKAAWLRFVMKLVGWYGGGG